jgi:formylglycine-generating enzyme
MEGEKKIGRSRIRRMISTAIILSLIFGGLWYYVYTRIHKSVAEIFEEKLASSVASFSSQGKSFIDPTTSMEFVGIPGGCFQMGSPPTEKDRRSNEGPQHEICVDSFWMGKYEVTVGQWRKFIREKNYRTDAEKDTEEKGCFSLKNNEWAYHVGYYWDNVGFAQTDLQPVVCVSYQDVQEFVHWLNQKSAQNYRLPTEAEWEYAARAGSTTSRYWGDDEKAACDYANVADISYDKLFSCDDGYKWSSPVGAFKANAFGLYDMLGNVWEWTGDWYGNDYYRSSPRYNPTGPRSSSNRLNRGGAWVCGPAFVRTAFRVWMRPWGRSVGVGFRLVQSF